MSKPQLFLLHFAGGNSFSFQFMKSYLPEFDFTPLELPGRGKRMKEPLIRDLDEAGEDILKQVLQNLRSDNFLIYGHSMGAVIALKLTESLEKRMIFPSQIIVTGNPGPGVKDNRKRYLMETRELKEELRKIGGVPDEVLADEEIFEFFEPMLKADFEVIEKDESLSFDPVKAPIYAIMGAEEEYVEAIDNWKDFTYSNFESRIFPGNHFFIYKHVTDVCAVIKKCYADTVLSKSF